MFSDHWIHGTENGVTFLESRGSHYALSGGFPPAPGYARRTRYWMRLGYRCHVAAGEFPAS
jgi:hypothetical protein